LKKNQSTGFDNISAVGGANITQQDVVKCMGIPYRVSTYDQFVEMSYNYHLKDCVVDPDKKQTKFKGRMRFTTKQEFCEPQSIGCANKAHLIIPVRVEP
jgi:hypothetical protein